MNNATETGLDIDSTSHVFATFMDMGIHKTKVVTGGRGIRDCKGEPIGAHATLVVCVHPRDFGDVLIEPIRSHKEH